MSRRRRMPAQRPGRSRQDYATPWELIRAVEARFGRLDVDLAARADNAKAPLFIPPAQDSLSVCWSKVFAGRFGWLNPEFGKIAPWAAKCAAESGLRIAMLTPASVGAVWYQRHVHGRALVLALSPRIRFEGAPGPFPKDCTLSLFHFGRSGFEPWRWTEGIPQAAERLARAEQEVLLARRELAAEAVADARARALSGQDVYELAARLLSEQGLGRWSRSTVYRVLATPVSSAATPVSPDETGVLRGRLSALTAGRAL